MKLEFAQKETPEDIRSLMQAEFDNAVKLLSLNKCGYTVRLEFYCAPPTESVVDFDPKKGFEFAINYQRRRDHTTRPWSEKD